MAFFLIFALQCLFPIFDAGAGEFTGVSIVNSEAQSRTYTVSGISADGNNVQSGSISLGPGLQRSALLPEIFGGASAAGTAWIRIDSASPACTGYLTQGSEEFLIGMEPAAAGGTTIYLPHISVNTGFLELAHTDTQIKIINPGGNAANVTAELLGLDGVVRGTVTVSIPSRGSRSLVASEAFGSVIPNNGAGGKVFEGYVRLASAEPVAAWQRIETPLSRSVLRGRAAEEIRVTAQAIIPHFVFGQDYGSTLNLINPTTASQTLQLNALDDRGNDIGETVQVTLAPGEGRRSSVGEFFRVVLPAIFPPPTISGYLRIRPVQGTSLQVVGNVEIFGVALGARGSSMLSPASDVAATTWILPFASGAGEYFTGYSIVNPNELLTVQTDVQVQVFDSAGNVAETRAVSLSPRNRTTGLAASGLTSGYIRFTSNFPIHVLGSIGTRNRRVLDQVPALR